VETSLLSPRNKDEGFPIMQRMCSRRAVPLNWTGRYAAVLTRPCGLIRRFTGSRNLRTGCEKQARVGTGGTNDDSALHKYFSYRESCYGRNVPDDRRQRTSAAASSETCGRRIQKPSPAPSLTRELSQSLRSLGRKPALEPTECFALAGATTHWQHRQLLSGKNPERVFTCVPHIRC
jgi:hypothetical protein